MKFLDAIFIAIANIYIKFYEEKDEEWFYFPLMIVTLCLSLNIMTLSFFFIDVDFYYYLILMFLIAFILHLRFENISYQEVKDTLTFKSKLLIYFLIIIDLTISFFLVYLSRIKYFE